MPWTLDDSGSWQHLKQTIREHWQANSDRYSRFYALGIDAFRITPYLRQLGRGMFGSYHGVTGNLTLDSRQQIHRTLRWAGFRQGLPQPLESSAETPAETTAP
jgi:outer membrane PBP1 activator LpoA protein